MTWEFNIKGNCELFTVALVDVEPNDAHQFHADGRREFIDPPANTLVRRDNAMMITHGSLTVEVEEQSPVEYVFDDFTWDELTGEMGNTNPFPYERQIYPTGDWMTLTGGPNGAQWVCFMPNNKRKISYTTFKGPHIYRCDRERETYAIVITSGHACLGGVGDCEQWKPYHFTPHARISADADPDTIVFYVWERM